MEIFFYQYLFQIVKVCAAVAAAAAGDDDDDNDLNISSIYIIQNVPAVIDN